MIGDAAQAHGARYSGRRIRVLPSYGRQHKYVNKISCMNSRRDPIQAAALPIKLEILHKWTDRRRAVASSYSESLKYLPVRLEPVWHHYVVCTRERDNLKDLLTEAGVGTPIHNPIPPHMQAAYNHLIISPEAVLLGLQLSDQVISRPIGPHLDAAAVTRVIPVCGGVS